MNAGPIAWIPATSAWLVRITVGAERHVPQWKIGVVPRVDAALVMNVVRLGPLDQKPRPPRRADVDVLVRVHEHERRGDDRRTCVREPERELEHARDDHALNDDLERMAEVRTEHVDAFGAVMQLVDPAECEISAAE